MTVLIYRLGRIGDTMVALPALRLIQRAFAGRRRILLTDRAPTPMFSAPHLLEGSGIIDGAIDYDLGERRPGALWDLAARIRRCGATTLVYLIEPRGRLSLLRDAAFFRACGIRSMVGLPWSPDLYRARLDDAGHSESEASRLARTIGALGDAALDDPANWQLSLSADEQDSARRHITAGMGERPFIAFDVTAKPAIREWGVERWRQVLTTLSSRHPDWGALFCGSATDAARVGQLATCWQGPTLLNGAHSPRNFYACVRHARLFVGLDSGPMHMAAAAGVPVVAVAAAQHLPGLWHPVGTGHAILSSTPPCAGCSLSICPRDNACIAAVTADSVIRACVERLPEPS